MNRVHNGDKNPFTPLEMYINSQKTIKTNDVKEYPNYLPIFFQQNYFFKSFNSLEHEGYVF